MEYQKQRRKKLDMTITNEEVGDFLIHMANILGKNFNTLYPFLDITFLTYRLNAVHPIIAKERIRVVYTFSLRIYQKELVVNPLDNTYCSPEVFTLLRRLIEKKQSILISGSTRCGKDRTSKILLKYILNMHIIIL